MAYDGATLALFLLQMNQLQGLISIDGSGTWRRQLEHHRVLGM